MACEGIRHVQSVRFSCGLPYIHSTTRWYTHTLKTLASDISNIWNAHFLTYLSIPQPPVFSLPKSRTVAARSNTQNRSGAHCRSSLVGLTFAQCFRHPGFEFSAQRPAYAFSVGNPHKQLQLRRISYVCMHQALDSANIRGKNLTIHCF